MISATEIYSHRKRLALTLWDMTRGWPDQPADRPADRPGPADLSDRESEFYLTGNGGLSTCNLAQSSAISAPIGPIVEYMSRLSE